MSGEHFDGKEFALIELSEQIELDSKQPLITNEGEESCENWKAFKKFKDFKKLISILEELYPIVRSYSYWQSGDTNEDSFLKDWEEFKKTQSKKAV